MVRLDVLKLIAPRAAPSRALGAAHPRVALEIAVVADQARERPLARFVAHRGPLVRGAAEDDGLAEMDSGAQRVDDIRARRAMRDGRVPRELGDGAGDVDVSAQSRRAACGDARVEVGLVAAEERGDGGAHRAVRAREEGGGAVEIRRGGVVVGRGVVRRVRRARAAATSRSAPSARPAPTSRTTRAEGRGRAWGGVASRARLVRTRRAGRAGARAATDSYAARRMMGPIRRMATGGRPRGAPTPARGRTAHRARGRAPRGVGPTRTPRRTRASRRGRPGGARARQCGA